MKMYYLKKVWCYCPLRYQHHILSKVYSNSPSLSTYQDVHTRTNMDAPCAGSCRLVHIRALWRDALCIYSKEGYFTVSTVHVRTAECQAHILRHFLLLRLKSNTARRIKFWTAGWQLPARGLRGQTRQWLNLCCCIVHQHNRVGDKLPTLRGGWTFTVPGGSGT